MIPKEVHFCKDIFVLDSNTFVNKGEWRMKRTYVKTKPRTVFDVSRIVTVHYYEFGSHFSFGGESHDFWELVYVDRGQVAVRRNEEAEITVRQGEILFHCPNEFHSIRALDSSPNFFVISFVCPSAAMSFFERVHTQLDKRLKGYVTSIIQEAERTYVIPKNDTELKKLARRPEAPLGGEQLVQSYLEQFLVFLARAITEKAPLPPAPGGGEEPPLVSEIRQYLEERLEENVRLTDLTAHFGYSRSFLTKHFRDVTGETPGAYFLKRKIQLAKRLIRETDLNFAQIAARLSFETPQYFSRVFRRYTGMTPTEFKNRAHI